MPEIQTGASVAIDFLSGFGKGMVQNDINRREKEKHEFQKQRWQQEMTAFAAQDELRNIQFENARLEIDMRKTQFDDLQATREQTKGFIGFMANAVGKAKGNPAERQAQLLEAYTQGAAEFTQADRAVGDKLIDMYSKIHQTGASRKAWKFKDIKNYDTGKKQTAIFGESGEIINFVPGEENLEVVNDVVAKGTEEYYAIIDQKFQAFLAGKGAVVGAESGMQSFDDFMDSTADDDERTKSEKAMDWIFETRNRLLQDAYEDETVGTLDQFLGRRLKNVIRNDAIRSEFVGAFAEKKEYTRGLDRIIGKFPLEDRAEKIAEMAAEFEALVPEYEMPEIRMELARLQNKLSLELREKQIPTGKVHSQEQLDMAQRVAINNRTKEEKLLKEFAAGRPDSQLYKHGRDWWDNFLGKGMPETFPDY